MDSNTIRVKRIREVLLRHSGALSSKEDLQLMAEKMSQIVGSPELRQLLQKSFVSGWDNLEEEIKRASDLQHNPRSEEDDDQSSFGGSSNLDSEQEEKSDNQQQKQDEKNQETSNKPKEKQDAHQQTNAKVLEGDVPRKRLRTEDRSTDQVKALPKPFGHIFPPFLPGMYLPPPPPTPNPNQQQPRPRPPEKPRVEYKPKPVAPTGTAPPNNYKPPTEKKNCLYIKNLPKHYNTAEALSNFFKKYGQIREVSSRVDKNTACISFFKEQDAINAQANDQKVFGKIFIFKTLNPDEEPPERLQEEIKNIEILRKKSECEEKTKAQIKVMRQELITKYAEKIRALLFLMNRFKGDKAELKTDFEQYKADKAQTDSLSDEKFMTFYEEKIRNKDYEWTLIVSNFPHPEDRKAVSDIFDKHGKNSATNKDGELQVRYLALDSIPKLLADPAIASLDIRFSNLKMHYYIDHLRTETVCKFFMIYIGLRIDCLLTSCSSVGSLSPSVSTVFLTAISMFPSRQVDLHGVILLFLEYYSPSSLLSLVFEATWPINWYFIRQEEGPASMGDGLQRKSLKGDCTTAAFLWDLESLLVKSKATLQQTQSCTTLLYESEFLQSFRIILSRRIFCCVSLFYRFFLSAILFGKD